MSIDKGGNNKPAPLQDAVMSLIRVVGDIDINAIDVSSFFALSIADAPVRKCDRSCPLWDKCMLKDKIEPNSRCPYELMIVAGEVDELMKRADVDPSDIVSITQFIEYASLNLLIKKIYKQLQDDGLLLDIPVIAKDEVVAVQKEAHPLLDILIKMIKTKMKILEEYILTPMSKSKAKIHEEANILDIIAEVSKEVDIGEDEDK